MTVGYVKNRMPDQYRWIVGLGNDELGYAVPLADYRVMCVADDLAGPGTCAALHAAGVIEFPDAVAGATCKADHRGPVAARRPTVRPPRRSPPAAATARPSARPNDHYEETNSAGWDLEADILAAVGVLDRRHRPDAVNPDFPGWWMGYTPPG